MSSGLERIRSILGSEETSDLSDEIINHALWEAYFDIERAVIWLKGEFCNWLYDTFFLTGHLEEQERQEAAKERKGELLFEISFPFVIRRFLSHFYLRSWFCRRIYEVRE